MLLKTWKQPEYSEWLASIDSEWNLSQLNTVCCSDADYEYPGINILPGSGSGWMTLSDYEDSWIGFYTEPIRVELISFDILGSSSYAPTTFEFQGSEDGEEWDTLGSYEWNENSSRYEVNSQKSYSFHRLYISLGNSDIQYISNFRMKAFTEVDADIHESDCNWTAPRIESDFEFGSIYCSSGKDPYKVLDTDLNTAWTTDNESEGWWKWELPYPIKIKSLIFINVKSEDPEYTNLRGRFYTKDLSSPLTDFFEVSKSGEQVTFYCNDIETDVIYFSKLGGKYSGIGNLIVNGSVTRLTHRHANLKDFHSIYSEGISIKKVYSNGNLIWER